MAVIHRIHAGLEGNRVISGLRAHLRQQKPMATDFRASVGSLPFCRPVSAVKPDTSTEPGRAVSHFEQGREALPVRR